ncbi:MAG: 2-oxoacid:acceptor oxidoreductase family protein [Candidatus Abyssubacteria bacterium]
MKKECRFCGYGGQGIILAGIILAEAAAIFEDRYVVQTQDYGPAARGDSSKTDVIISDGPIDYPKCSRLDLLVALSQRGFEENKNHLKEGGILIVDSNNVRPSVGTPTHGLPMTEVARDRIGSPMSVNMMALGAAVALSRVARLESVCSAMLARVPERTKEWNLAALRMGYELAEGCARPKRKGRPK